LREDADFEEVYLDSTIVRAHQHAAGAEKKRRVGSWSFSWGIEHQNPCLRRRFGALAHFIVTVGQVHDVAQA